MTKMDDLLKAWQDFFDLQVVNTNEFAPFLLHAFLGGILRTKYIRGGHGYKPKVHVYIIQDGSTGKGECYEAFCRLVQKYTNKIVYKTTDITDASLAGGINENGDEIKGLLESVHFLWLDEGGEAISKSGNKNKEKIIPILNGVMDKSQIIHHDTLSGIGSKFSKAKKYKKVIDKYKDKLKDTALDLDARTKITDSIRRYKAEIEKIESWRPKTAVSTIIFTSIPTQELKSFVIQLNFFSRGLIHYKKFTYDEMKALALAQTKLLTTNNWSIDEPEKRIVTILDDMKNNEDNYYNESTGKYTILINPNIVDELNKIKQSIFELYIKNKFFGKKQDSLQSIAGRIDNIFIPIAVHSAIVEGHKQVELSDFVYAEKYIKLHLDNASKLLAITERGDPQLDAKIFKAFYDYLKKMKGCNQEDMIKYFRRLKDLGEWEHGGKNSIRNWLLYFVKKGMITEVTYQNQKLYYLPEDYLVIIK